MTLIEFIIKAKLSSYAGGPESIELKFNDGSKGFELVSDGYRYVDRFHGFNPFSGSECVFDSDNILVWAMNYYGEVLPNCSDPEGIYSFLKEAMRLISPEFPFRGPAELAKQNLRYENIQKGALQRFHGIESIYLNNEKVYVLYYHGGRLNKVL